MFDENTYSKAKENERQVSKQLVEYFLEKYSAPYQQHITAEAARGK